MKVDRREVAAVFAGGILGTLARVGLDPLFAIGRCELAVGGVR